MHCPVCKQVNLIMSERQGIEIDYCPQCRGVWLDRGELDKIIEKSATQAPTAPKREQPAAPSHAPQHGYDRYESSHGGHYKKKKREGFLSDLFDFD